MTTLQRQPKVDHLVNHVVIVLDGSGSMSDHKEQLIKVVDELIAHLARRSQESKQETRVTIYMFDDVVNLLIWDMDVLRAPSIRGLYEINGMTALIDATMRAISDLKLVPQFGGDHAIVMYVVTDGRQNAGALRDGRILEAEINGLGEEWTVAALVPDVLCAQEARQFGFPKGNVALWDTSSEQGAEEVASAVTKSFDTFTTMRASGGVNSRSTKQLFAPDPHKINDAAVAALGMTPVKGSKYDLLPISIEEKEKKRMIDFFAENALPWRLGHNFYELKRDEYISPDKELALVKTGQGAQIVYIDEKIRGLLGLPDDKKVLVAPGLVPGWGIFVQSKNAGRYMRPGRLLIRKA